MRVIIAGSRSVTDMRLLEEAIAEAGFEITEVVCGMAKGADRLGLEWAKRHGIPVAEFPARWGDLEAPGAVVVRREDGTFYNRNAGFQRNAEMAAYADALIALWDGSSSGTLHMLQEAKKRDLKVYMKRC